MPPLTPRYSRNELVDIIGDFYTFLTTFYIPSSSLKRPPPAGWPNITKERTKEFGKSPLVIDLLKHLPYIDEEDSRIQYKCDVVDWSLYSAEGFTAAGQDEDGPTGEMGIRRWIEERAEEKENEGHEDDDDASDDEDEEDWDSYGWDEGPEKSDLPNMIALAEGYESGGRDIVLDSFKGVIYEDILSYHQMDGVDVREYFKELQEKYEKLILVPIRGEMFEDGTGEQYEEAVEEAVKEYKAIYRSHGWPGDGFRKEEALEAVELCRRRREDEEDEEDEDD
ncbi:hypothetical protein N0V90_008096 [Kalmusia sp. IMI 367209]|nr:hypothetical protein N0V90_008096 [Kalmusia sp. IMI 367209]